MDGTNVCTNSASKTTHSSITSDKRYNNALSHLRQPGSKKALPIRLPTPQRYRMPGSRPPPHHHGIQMGPHLGSPNRLMTIQLQQPNQTHRKRITRPSPGRMPLGTPVTSGHQAPHSQTLLGEERNSSRPSPKNSKPQSRKTNPAASFA